MIEQTKPVNPYESNPYEKTVYGGVPDLPPPPPKRPKYKMLMLVLVLFSAMCLLLSGVVTSLYFGELHSHSQSKQVTTTVPVPKQTPTVSSYPIVTGFSAPVSATSVFNYMTCSDGPGQCVPSNSVGTQFWTCCKYFPEGGARTWMDDQSHINLDVATFATPDEAAADVAGLRTQGFEVNLVNSCVLFYTKGVSSGTIGGYIWKMQNICGG